MSLQSPQPEPQMSDSAIAYISEMPLMGPEYVWQEKLSIDDGELFERLYTLGKQGKLQRHFQYAWGDFQEAREQLLAGEQ